MLHLVFERALYTVGDRIQLGGVVGDVTDVRILRTSLLEIGNWVGADQLSGRVVTVTNLPCSKTQSPLTHRGLPILWDEFTVPVAYGPHWERAQSTILDAVVDYAQETTIPAKIALQQLPGMSLIESPDTGTQVFISLTEHWVACTLRYVVQARSRRTVTHRLQVQVLKALAPRGIKIAAPALTVVKYPAERTWKEQV